MAGDETTKDLLFELNEIDDHLLEPIPGEDEDDIVIALRQYPLTRATIDDDDDDDDDDDEKHHLPINDPPPPTQPTKTPLSYPSITTASHLPSPSSLSHQKGSTPSTYPRTISSSSSSSSSYSSTPSSPPSSSSSKTANERKGLYVPKGKDEEKEGEDGKEPEVPVKWDRATMMRLVRMAGPEVWLILGGLVGLGISSVSFLILPQFAGMLIDSISTADKTMFGQALLIISLITIIGAVAAFGRAALFTIAGERIVNRLRQQVFNHILKQDIEFFDRNRTGDLTNRLSSDCTALRSAITVNVSMVLRSLAQCIGAIVILFVSSWKLTLVMLAVTPLLAVAAVFYGKYVRDLSKTVQDKLAEAGVVAEEAFGNIRTVRSLSSESYECTRYNDRSNEAYEISKKLGLAYGGFAGLGVLFANLSIGGVLWYGGVLVISGEMTVGGLSAFLLYTLTVAIAIGTITAVWGDFMKAVGSSHRIFEILDREPLVRFEGGVVPPQPRGEIRFENVCFSYPTRAETPVLRSLNLHLQPGKVVALVGKSGGGKSTCGSLIEVFYYANSGRITFDGIDITQVNRQWLTRHVAIVSQEPDLFATSIEENIAYGMIGEVTHEQIEEAARLANAHDFIVQLPEGYRTQVGERGVRLSGGQKQRIAIARAIIRNPFVLLLDEATSALDAESEILVQAALDQLLQQKNKSRTTLVIAHRLSTVQNADEVVVIDEGAAIERGTHYELLQQRGAYHNLIKHQLFSAETLVSLE